MPARELIAKAIRRERQAAMPQDSEEEDRRPGEDPESPDGDGDTERFRGPDA